MNKTSPGFIRIIMIMAVLVGLLIFSGINVRDQIQSIQSGNFLTETRTQIISGYETHLQTPINRFVINPVQHIYNYTIEYVITAIADFLQTLINDKQVFWDEFPRSYQFI